MAVLLDKLKQRPINAPVANIPQGAIQQSPLPTITETISRPPTRPLTTPISQRVQGLNERGVIGSLPQFQNSNKQFIADLPEDVQLQGIQQIIAGQDTQSPIINNFVKIMAAQGKTPEEIRQAFINQQKTSADPLALA